MEDLLPCKQLWGSDGEYFTGINVILFEEVNDGNDQSLGNEDVDDLMILGQAPTINSDTNNSSWVTEAQNTLLSQDP